MFKPKYHLHRVTDITPEFMKINNYKAIILDVDNTLSTHHGTKYIDNLTDWLTTMQNSDIKLIILSNSVKKRIEPFAKGLNLPYIHTGLKPLPFGFIRAKRYLNLKYKNIINVGDQIFTDIVGGNLCGLNTVFTDLILPETSLRFKLKRKAERRLISLLKI